MMPNSATTQYDRCGYANSAAIDTTAAPLAAMG